MGVLALEEGFEVFVFEEGDEAFFFDEGAEAFVAEEVEEAGGVGDAAVLEACFVELEHLLFVEGAAVGDKAGEVGLGDVVHGVDLGEPGGDGGLAQGFFEACEPGDARAVLADDMGLGEVAVVADARDIPIVRYAHHTHPEHEGAHEGGGEDAAGAGAAAPPREKLREPAHAVEEDGEGEDACHPCAQLHHPRLRPADDEGEEGEAVALDEDPHGDGADGGDGEQEHLDDPLEQGEQHDGGQDDTQGDDDGGGGVHGGESGGKGALMGRGWRAAAGGGSGAGHPARCGRGRGAGLPARRAPGR